MVTLLAWLNKKAGAIRRGIARQMGALSAVPYCAVYSEAAGFIPPAKFKTSDYSGLIAWQAVKDPQAVRIISYWQDDKHYDYSEAGFRAALGLARPPAWKGATGDLHAKDPTWWPSSVKEAIIGLSALIGAAGIVWAAADKAYELFWATPQLAVSFADPEFKITEGQRNIIAITVINSGFVGVELKASGQLVGNGIAAQPVEIDRREVPSVEQNGSVTLKATVAAPSFQPATPSPFGYEMVLTVNAQTWSLGHVTSFPAKVPVTIWPRSLGWTRHPDRILENNPRVYAASGYIYTGKAFPAGLHATVSFDAAETADLAVNIPEFQPSQGVSPSPPVDGKRSFSWDFNSPALSKNEKRRFEVIISPKSGQPPPSDWSTLANSLEVVFYE